jgi:hypothetical protein
MWNAFDNTLIVTGTNEDINNFWKNEITNKLPNFLIGTASEDFTEVKLLDGKIVIHTMDEDSPIFSATIQLAEEYDLLKFTLVHWELGRRQYGYLIIKNGGDTRKRYTNTLLYMRDYIDTNDGGAPVEEGYDGTEGHAIGKFKKLLEKYDISTLLY